MFQVKVYEVCPVTGYIQITIEYCLYNGMPKVIKENYKTEPDAKRRLTSLRLDYILFTLEKYVSECRTIMETGGAPNKTGRAVALEKMSKGIHYLQDKQLEYICNLLLEMEPFLSAILPPASNPRYEFLHSIYLKINTFCNQTLNDLRTCPA